MSQNEYEPSGCDVIVIIIFIALITFGLVTLVNQIAALKNRVTVLEQRDTK